MTPSYRSAGDRPPRKNAPEYRSAGACPPRSPDPRENRTQTVSLPIEAWRGTGPRPTVRGRRCFHRSAGACPPRSFDLREKRTPTNRFPPDRGTARDRPSPYGEGGRFFHRSAGALGCHTRIRAGFPRDRTPYAKNARQPTVSLPIEARRGTGPRPTGKWRLLRDRSAGACPPRGCDRPRHSPAKLPLT